MPNKVIGYALLFSLCNAAQAFNALDDNLITPNSVQVSDNFRLIRSEEDYRSFRDSPPQNFLDQIKFIPLSSDRLFYLTLGGELRENYESYHNENFGQFTKPDDHLYNRVMLSGDAHFGDYNRVYLEFQSATASTGNYPAKPIDVDRLDINQLFFDQKFHLGNGALTFRIGRQELDYGAERLISVREGPNARMGFDGIKSWLNLGESRLDAFWVLPVTTEPGEFDNTTTVHQQLWALYWTSPFSNANWLKGFDLYYIGYRKDDAIYNSVTGNELRHSMGARMYAPPAKEWDLDAEVIEQFGSFSSRNIEAWTFATDGGYCFTDMALQPRAALKLAAASGDHGGGTLGTFNPLFPRGAYLDLSTQIGPSNFMSFNPYVNLHVGEIISIAIGDNFLWRESTSDGLYNPGMGILRSGLNSSASYIGSEPAITANYRLDKHVNFLAGYAHLFAGPFIKDTGPGEDTDYYTLYAYYVF